MGQKNYIRHIPLFATQIALMRENELILGVSNAPAMIELLHAERDRGRIFEQSTGKRYGC